MDRQRGWWRGASGYEVYLRSFADSDGDGVGDLPGLRSHLHHVADLGVDFVWVTPFYPSPLADHGYDVADYTAVDPRYGTLDDFDAVVAEAHRLGLRLLIDLVPNHSSSQHPWFLTARSSRGDPRRDYYIWRDPAPDGGPPNNWVSVFGGPAWTLDERTGQYWLHLFLPEQPDLNWANPAVADEFDRILRFWLDRGIDGFRVDVAHGLVKDPSFADNPTVDPLPGGGPDFDALDHRYDVDQPGVLDVHRRWRTVADEYGAVLLGEVYLLDPRRITRYVAGGEGLHLALCPTTVRTRWDPDGLRTTLRTGCAAGGDRFVWTLSSHDDPRAPTRFGGGECGRRRALSYLVLLAGLPGTLLLYQGDELALVDGDVPPDRVEDPAAVRGVGRGRDPTRTPMPWRAEAGWGFTSGKPWLPFGGRRAEDTVAAQQADPASYLNRTTTILALRRGLPGGERLRWLTDAGPLVAYRRGEVVVVANCGSAPAALDLPDGDWTGIFATSGSAGGRHRGAVEVAPDEAVILRR